MGLYDYGGYQQPPMQMQRPQQGGFPVRDVRFVTSEEAAAYIVYPSTAALLIDRANGTAYLKTADAMGYSTMERFTFTKVNPDGSPIQPKIEQPVSAMPDMSEFVRKSDIAEIEAQYAALLKEVKVLQRKAGKATDKVEEE